MRRGGIFAGRTETAATFRNRGKERAINKSVNLFLRAKAAKQLQSQLKTTCVHLQDPWILPVLL
jgi:hypothetical protein